MSMSRVVTTILRRLLARFFGSGFPVTARIVPAAMLTLGLAACGGGGGGGVLGTGIGGGSSTSSSSGSSESGPLGTARNYLLYGGATVPAPIANPNERSINCPKVNVLEGTAAMRIGTQSGSATEVSYQASLGETARECTVQGATVAIKVGVEGRLLVGMLGKPGTYSVPLRIVVKRLKVVLYSKLVRINVTVPAGDTQAGFTHVEEGIVLPLTENDPAEEYDLLVGFDPNGKADPAEKKPTRRRR